MARLPFVEPAQVQAEFPDLTIHQNFQRVYANSPAAMREFMGVSGYVRKHSALDPRLRELAVLQVGYTARSPYVFTHHVKGADSVGISAAELRALAAGSTSGLATLGPLEQAVLTVARAMTLREEVPGAAFDALRAAIGDAPLMDLLFVIGHYIAMATLIGTLHIELEESYQGYLTEFPMTPAN